MSGRVSVTQNTMGPNTLSLILAMSFLVPGSRDSISFSISLVITSWGFDDPGDTK